MKTIQSIITKSGVATQLKMWKATSKKRHRGSLENGKAKEEKLGIE